ncbi:hypothetical protein SNE40_004264 [Patella caerulea]|uniref:E3 ubiquitin-protein ligase n=1 Tax=Patella caerulea TaxID=87958 RepID=A0AAN8KBE5_PATCE
MAASTSNLSRPTSSSFNFGVIFWEWLEDNGKWHPYDPDVVGYIEQNYGKANSISLGVIDTALSLYKIDFSTNPMCQIRLDSGRTRCIRRKVYPMTNPTSHQIIWKWESDYPGFWNTYDFEVSSLIEDVYCSQRTPFIDLSQPPLQMPYFIDLKNLQQVRIETSKCRSIRREKLKTPYPVCSSLGNQQHQQSSHVISNINHSSGLSHPQAVPILNSISNSGSSHSHQAMSNLNRGGSGSSHQQAMSNLNSGSSGSSHPHHAMSNLNSGGSGSSHPHQAMSNLNSGGSGLSHQQAMSNLNSGSSGSPHPHHAMSNFNSGSSGSSHPHQAMSNLNSGSSGSSHPHQAMSTLNRGGNGSSHPRQVMSNLNSGSSCGSSNSHHAMSNLNSCSLSHQMISNASQSLSSNTNNNVYGNQGHTMTSTTRKRPLTQFDSSDSDDDSTSNDIGIRKLRPKKSKNSAMPVSSHMNPMPSTSTFPRTSAQPSSIQLQQNFYSSQPQHIPGMMTASPFLNSLSSVNGSSLAVSNGPLTRQQLSLLQYPGSVHVPGVSNNMLPAGPVHSSNQYPSVTNNMMNLKSHGSKISPVVSNITNVLTSPIVPGAFSHQPVSLHGNFQQSAYSLPTPNPQTSTFSAKGHIVLPKLKKSKGKSGADMPHQYFKAVLKPSDAEDCCICCEKLNSESDYGKSNHAEGEVVSLSLCAHMFHRQCLRAMYDSGPKDGSLQCPNCKKIHGFKHGICPAGEMHFWTIPESLPGYDGCCTICVKYFIRPGTQGHEHPNPGRKFSARGFPRIGYLPDNEKGRKILQLFTIAWQRRVMFTIGSSSTTGETDTVTWNEIHHKTEFGSNESGHGYPDPNYLDNVLLELAIQGVTEDDLTSTGI